MSVLGRCRRWSGNQKVLDHFFEESVGEFPSCRWIKSVTSIGIDGEWSPIKACRTIRFACTRRTTVEKKKYDKINVPVKFTEYNKKTVLFSSTEPVVKATLWMSESDLVLQRQVGPFFSKVFSRYTHIVGVRTYYTHSRIYTAGNVSA